VISGHIEERHVDTRDQVLQIFEGQIAARDDEVWPQCVELISVKRFVDLVGDGENSRQARISRRTDSRAISAARAPSKPTSSPTFRTVAICGAE
jgi:hypothetical protein